MFFLAPGKINLALNICGHRSDGYHEVDMILQSISLADEIELIDQPEGISLEIDPPILPADSSNLAWKAAELIQDHCNITRGVHIKLKKKIPFEAGLAGGSADAAAVLRGLNRLWDLKLSQNELEELASKLGSDVPFCIAGGTARGRGRGDQLEVLPDCPVFYVLLVKPAQGVPTPWAYQGYQGRQIVHPPDVEKMVLALEKQDRDQIRGELGNVFEEWIPAARPDIQTIMDRLASIGAKGIGLSGSGPTVFALGDTEEEVLAWRESVRDLGEVYLCRTIKGEEF